MDSATDYFALFDLPQSFEIDREELSRRYREAQRTSHPDRFAGASDAERRLAMQTTTQLNEAFNTLKEPLDRARHLLTLLGRPPNDNAGVMDEAFLMEQMELRETLAEIPERADPPSALNEFLNRLENQMDRLTARLANLFQAQDLEQAAEETRKLQFFHRLYQEALSLEERL